MWGMPWCLWRSEDNLQEGVGSTFPLCGVPWIQPRCSGLSAVTFPVEAFCYPAFSIHPACLFWVLFLDSLLLCSTSASKPSLAPFPPLSWIMHLPCTFLLGLFVWVLSFPYLPSMHISVFCLCVIQVRQVTRLVLSTYQWLSSQQAPSTPSFLLSSTGRTSTSHLAAYNSYIYGWRPEDQEFKDTFSSLESLRPAWAACDPDSKKE